MQKSNSKTFTCVGVNSTISVIKSNRFRIEKVLIVRNSKAEKDQKLNRALKAVKSNFIKKVNDRKLSSRFKTQGVEITFSELQLLSDSI